MANSSSHTPEQMERLLNVHFLQILANTLFSLFLSSSFCLFLLPFLSGAHAQPGWQASPPMRAFAFLCGRKQFSSLLPLEEWLNPCCLTFESLVGFCFNKARLRDLYRTLRLQHTHMAPSIYIVDQLFESVRQFMRHIHVCWTLLIISRWADGREEVYERGPLAFAFISVAGARVLTGTTEKTQQKINFWSFWGDHWDTWETYDWWLQNWHCLQLWCLWQQMDISHV